MSQLALQAPAKSSILDLSSSNFTRSVVSHSLSLHSDNYAIANWMQKDQDSLQQDIPARLLVADWNDILPRVQLWANHFHKRYLRNIRAAPSPEDLVQEAIVKLYTGRRKLPDHVPLITVIINNIQSDIWNFLTREGIVGKSAQGKGRKGWGRHLGLEEWMQNFDEQAAPSQTELNALQEVIKKEIDGDKQLGQMVDLLFQDPLLKPRDLARLMGITVKDVNNAQKRLRRRLQSLRKSLSTT